MITFGQLRHQARLMGRSARHLAVQPRDGREVGRLLRSGLSSTVELRVPWLPFRLIDILDERLSRGMRVFEFGGGGSTLWFLDHGADVVTVEHHEGWARTLRSSAADAASWTLLVRPLDDDGSSYVHSIGSYPEGYFDLVVVDGRFRARCVEAGLSKIRRGGMLVVDDVDRPEYWPALSRVPWPRTDIVGFAPAKPSLSYTSLFIQPDD